MNKNTFENINVNDEKLKKDHDHINVDMEAQEFDEEYSHISSIEDFDDKLIKYLERMVRGSYEYKEYIKYLKDELDIKQCSLTPGLNLNNIHFQLEFHHYPLTLFDIINIIGSKMLKDQSKTISLFDIMEKTMEEHYAGHVGLVPLSATTHEMFHNGSVQIPIESVYGNFNDFLTKYKDDVAPEISEKVLMARNIHESDAKTFNQKLLKNTLDYHIKYNK